MSANFLVVLTQVRPVRSDQPRDERLRPEMILESIPVDEPVAALTLFNRLCRLAPVRQGRQRTKLIPLPTTSVGACPTVWGAPVRPHAAEISVSAR
ncbi:MAG TPA: hypothetical protein VFC19_00395 [Candidatus Limnocylindrales bacterium]|nr:hypothetical protein [Candidatus Limnocylindrales bacterium]